MYLPNQPSNILENNSNKNNSTNSRTKPKSFKFSIKYIILSFLSIFIITGATVSGIYFARSFIQTKKALTDVDLSSLKTFQRGNTTNETILNIKNKIQDVLDEKVNPKIRYDVDFSFNNFYNKYLYNKGGSYDLVIHASKSSLYLTGSQEISIYISELNPTAVSLPFADSASFQNSRLTYKYKDFTFIADDTTGLWISNDKVKTVSQCTGLPTANTYKIYNIKDYHNIIIIYLKLNTNSKVQIYFSSSSSTTYNNFFLLKNSISGISGVDLSVVPIYSWLFGLDRIWLFTDEGIFYNTEKITPEVAGNWTFTRSQAYASLGAGSSINWTEKPFLGGAISDSKTLLVVSKAPTTAEIATDQKVFALIDHDYTSPFVSQTMDNDKNCPITQSQLSTVYKNSPIKYINKRFWLLLDAPSSSANSTPETQLFVSNNSGTTWIPVDPQDADGNHIFASVSIIEVSSLGSLQEIITVESNNAQNDSTIESYIVDSVKYVPESQKYNFSVFRVESLTNDSVNAILNIKSEFWILTNHGIIVTDLKFHESSADFVKKITINNSTDFNAINSIDYYAEPEVDDATTNQAIAEGIKIITESKGVIGFTENLNKN